MLTSNFWYFTETKSAFGQTYQLLFCLTCSQETKIKNKNAAQRDSVYMCVCVCVCVCVLARACVCVCSRWEMSRVFVSRVLSSSSSMIIDGSVFDQLQGLSDQLP